jgi:hypothetical protein
MILIHRDNILQHRLKNDLPRIRDGKSLLKKMKLLKYYSYFFGITTQIAL